MKKAIRMKKKNILLLSIAGLWTMAGFAQAAKDSARIARNLTIDEVVVTGTRNETDIRHLPMTISVVMRILRNEDAVNNVVQRVDDHGNHRRKRH